MSELTINELIKIIIGVLVVAAVIITAVVIFKNYISPYFSGVFPEEPERNISTSYYKELMKEENKVAYIGEKGIIIFTSNNNIKDYYIKGEQIKKIRTIFETNWLSWTIKDQLMGSIDNKGIINIKIDKLKENPILDNIEKGEKIGKEIYKNKF